MRATVGSLMMKASSMAGSGKVLEHHTNNAVGMFGIDLKLVCVQIRTREGANIKQAACKPFNGFTDRFGVWAAHSKHTILNQYV